jgi:hypothetical protein
MAKINRERNYVHEMQSAVNSALYECAASMSDMYETKEARDAYRYQYDILKEIQKIVTDFVTKINQQR